MSNYLDLSSLMARLLIAVCGGATFALLGMWLREGDALGFAATVMSVSVTWYLVSSLRGQRVGKRTAAAERFQPIVDALAEYPGGKVVAQPAFKRGMMALLVGFVVAGAESLVGNWLLAGTGMSPLWRGLVALAIIMFPLYILLEWMVSRNSYAGTRFASTMLDAIWKVIHPESTTTPWTGTSQRTQVLGFGIARTVITLAARVVAQVLIPMVFSSWISVGFIFALVVTCIAGWPLIMAGIKAMRAKKVVPNTEASIDEGGEAA